MKQQPKIDGYYYQDCTLHIHGTHWFGTINYYENADYSNQNPNRYDIKYLFTNSRASNNTSQIIIVFPNNSRVYRVLNRLCGHLSRLRETNE